MCDLIFRRVVWTQQIFVVQCWKSHWVEFNHKFGNMNTFSRILLIPNMRGAFLWKWMILQNNLNTIKTYRSICFKWTTWIQFGWSENFWFWLAKLSKLSVGTVVDNWTQLKLFKVTCIRHLLGTVTEYWTQMKL